MKLEYNRFRRSPWATEEPIDDEKSILKLDKRHGGKEIELNLTSKLVWQLSDGTKNMQEIVDLFCDAYPKETEIKENVVSVVEKLLDQNFLVNDGGEGALEYQGDVVRNLVPSVELLWQLELIRQFLFGVLRVTETEALDTDLEQLLGQSALDNAMNRDADSAGSIGDSCTLSYKGVTKSDSFKASSNIIIDELRKLCPEIESDITISGNAVYLRGSHMGWHSNHSRSDGRIYCSWAEKPKANFFRYKHPLTGEIITDWEEPGWNIKSFTIPPKPGRLWHCIGANSLRLSLGFRYNLPESQ